MNTDIKINSHVKFALDGGVHAYGEGIVKNILSNELIEVELTTNCKEFTIGTLVLVYSNELIK